MRFKESKATTMNRMPSLFVSHGAPTFAIEPALAGEAERIHGVSHVWRGE